MRMVRDKISTTNWVIATSGALRTKKVKQSPNPTAPKATTEESKSLTSSAAIEPMIMRIIKI
jgi:hypothetical protein